MKNELITSLQNPLVKNWRQLNKSRAHRMEQGLFLAEGEHMTQEAIQSGSAFHLAVSENAVHKYPGLLQANIPFHILSEHVFASLCDAKTPQGVLAICRYPTNHQLQDLGSRIVCLNAVQDPGNVGTILRTMDAAGFTGLLVDEKTADAYSPKVLRATMGSIFRIPIMQTSNLAGVLEQLRSMDFEILAGDLLGEPFFANRKRLPSTCIIIGNEGAGIAPEIKEKATLRLKIPMMGGAESLNAAVAAAVMMYEDVRNRLIDP